MLTLLWGVKMEDDQLSIERDTLERLLKVGLIHEQEYSYARDLLESKKAEA